MPPPHNFVNFTSTSGNVICQRCKVLFPEDVELHFLHDATGQGPGKKVCDECRQYYITKTEIAEQSTRKFLSKIIIWGSPGQLSYSGQPTPVQLATQSGSHSVSRQNVRKAVAAAQREGKQSIFLK
jgi:hypothetical protein